MTAVDLVPHQPTPTIPAVTVLTRRQLVAVLEAAALTFTSAGSARYADNRGRPDPACPVQVAGLPRAVLRRHGDESAVARFGGTCLRLSSEHAGARSVLALLVELTRVLGADVVADAVLHGAVLHDGASRCSDVYLVGITLDGEPRKTEPCCAHPLSIHGEDGCWDGWANLDDRIANGAGTGCWCAMPGTADR